MKKLLILTTAMAITCSANAGQRDFAKIDTNMDETLAMTEFMVNIKPEGMETMTKSFHRRDKDKNGVLTQEEYTFKNKK
tara:strand:+ start:435 stop:671 length:237 start_codon:yes stop_codon:yes gene_type:complete